jgi:hypothetical protein
MEPKVDRSEWKPGQRVARKGRDDLGTIAEIDRGVVKVKWDRGQTSYYQPGESGNVKLVE